MVGLSLLGRGRHPAAVWAKGRKYQARLRSSAAPEQVDRVERLGVDDVVHVRVIGWHEDEPLCICPVICVQLHPGAGFHRSGVDIDRKAGSVQRADDRVAVMQLDHELLGIRPVLGVSPDVGSLDKRSPADIEHQVGRGGRAQADVAIMRLDAPSLGCGQVDLVLPDLNAASDGRCNAIDEELPAGAVRDHRLRADLAGHITVTDNPLSGYAVPHHQLARQLHSPGYDLVGDVQPAVVHVVAHLYTDGVRVPRVIVVQGCADDVPGGVAILNHLPYFYVIDEIAGGRLAVGVVEVVGVVPGNRTAPT